MAKNGPGQRPYEKTKDRTTSRLLLDVREVNGKTQFKEGSIGCLNWHNELLSYQLKADSIVVGIDPGLDTVPLVDGKCEIKLDRTSCHFGGERSWFKCPSCEARVGTLYLNKGGFECRKCCDLAYPSQLECHPSRQIAKAMKIRRRLGDTGNFLAPRPEKPKGMHYMTYWRQLLRLRQTEAEVNRAMMKMMFPDRPHWNSLCPSVERAFAEFDAASGDEPTTPMERPRD